MPHLNIKRDNVQQPKLLATRFSGRAICDQKSDKVGPAGLEPATNPL